MAETTYYVDVDVVGGAGDGSSLANAYSSLALAMGARDADITAGNAHRFLCHNTLGGADGLVTFSGLYITDADSYVSVVPAVAYRHAGIYDNSKYRIEIDDDDNPFRNNIEYFRVDGVQFTFEVTPDNNSRGISSITIDAVNDIRYSNLLVKGISAGTGWNRAAQSGDADADPVWWNCIFYGAFTWGPYALGDEKFYNCTVNGCTIAGILRASGTVDVQNCLVFETADDFNGTFNSITYCRTDDDHTGDSGTNAVITQVADDYAALVTNADGGDFSVTDSSSELYNTGDGGTPKVTFTDDIIGTTRGPADGDWDIGAFELVAAIGNAGIMTTNTGYWGPTF